MAKFKSIVFLFIFSFFFLRSFACQCPLTSLSKEECSKYDLIFKGRVVSVTECGSHLAEAVFETDELYKGNATKRFNVVFNCDEPCAVGFKAGEEWIIYTHYKQMNNAKMNWCSRSRKYFKVSKQDFYLSTYGNDYDDEVKFLRENLGIHRIIPDPVQGTLNRNERPDTTQTIIYLVVSLLVMILFYWLFGRYFKAGRK
jgi:hypothetical protein